MLNNPQEATRMSENGNELLLNKYGQEIMRQKITDMYTKVLVGKKQD
jgi:hypothetical protein